MPAFTPSSAHTDAISKEGLVYMALLAVQFGLQPILNKEYLSRESIKTVVVLVNEVTKIIIAGAMLFLFSQDGHRALKSWTLTGSLQTAGLPAFIYAIQNVLMLTGYNQLDGLTLNLINQTKTLFAAIAVYFLLGRKQSTAQCFALFGMFCASLLLTSSGSGAHQGAAEYEAWLLGGVLPVFAASILSGVASAITQRNLQKDQRNTYVFSMELGMYSSICLLIKLALGDGDAALIQKHGAFHSFPLTTMLPIILQAFGGIIVGQVVKHAGGVRKGFSILAGILMTGLFDYAISGRPLTSAKLLALPLVLVSTYVHMTRPYKEKNNKLADKKKS
eukprot:TRINITY_DN8915_c0_g1_i1.p2 TRINITY_DN8915_c0_g1~~TRINITY_DN8915_c0_g1_i1.p2  ORF type:complete len:333 (+),score=64.76 TRINITY_DN8915_c0_g1_i1:1679-2677(+)